MGELTMDKGSSSEVANSTEYIGSDVLIEAVSECLRNDVLPALSGDRELYLVRVCMNALGMALRDLRVSSEQGRAELLALAQLVGSGGPGGAQLLSMRLRAGDVPENALPVLKANAAARAVRANPKFKP